MARMRYGVAKSLEEEADRLLRESLVGVKSHTAKRDILTASKLKNRMRREVYSKLPVDGAYRRGTFTKVASPYSHLNSTEVQFPMPTNRTHHRGVSNE